MVAAAGWLAWMVSHTEIFFADGLRYIEQARQIERGKWTEGIRRAVDHPLYPLAVALAHRTLMLGDGPQGWQLAAQTASAAAGVLLVVPLYLVARSLFGGSSAWLGTLFAFLVPMPAHVLADTLSESTFLLFWTWGFWTALRYLRAGAIGWLLASLGFGALAYLSRPEGLLMPLALAATLAIIPLIPSARLGARRWWSAVLVLAVGGLAVVGPYVAIKGGVGTKPAVARLLGLSPPSRPDAVERERPLDPRQSTYDTFVLSARATHLAVRGAVTLPLLVLAALGFGATFRRARNVRPWLFLAVVVAASLTALMRLYATGGYCSPRHALLIALPFFAAAAAGLRVIIASAVRASRILRLPGARRFAAAASAVFALVLVFSNRAGLLEPVGAAGGGYREAGSWLAAHVGRGERVVDLTGWSLYYSQRPGYVFATLIAAPADQGARWVVAREAHVSGPWPYCRQLRSLIAGSKLVARFPAKPRRGQSKVSIYERPVATTTPAAEPAREASVARPATLR
jgi:hypothetical protein